jgi:hypothetical protein
VAVSRAYSSGGVYTSSGGQYGGNSGSYSGSAVTYAQVSLCRYCDEERAEAQRQAAEVVKALAVFLGVGSLVVIVAVLMFVVVFAAGLEGALAVGLVIFGGACFVPLALWLRRK